MIPAQQYKLLCFLLRLLLPLLGPLSGAVFCDGGSGAHDHDTVVLCHKKYLI
jgi:hypothetical protein